MFTKKIRRYRRKHRTQVRMIQVTLLMLLVAVCVYLVVRDVSWTTYQL